MTLKTLSTHRFFYQDNKIWWESGQNRSIINTAVKRYSLIKINTESIMDHNSSYALYFTWCLKPNRFLDVLFNKVQYNIWYRYISFQSYEENNYKLRTVNTTDLP